MPASCSRRVTSSALLLPSPKKAILAAAGAAVALAQPQGITCLAEEVELPTLKFLPQCGHRLAVPAPLPSPLLEEMQPSLTSQDPAGHEGGFLPYPVHSGGMEPASAPGSPQPPGARDCPCGTCGSGFPLFLMFLLASDQKCALSACY